MKLFIMTVSSLLLSFSVANAAQIGAAGCGLGNVVIGGKDSQVIAATLNGTGIQTFGITSGTSNCVDSGGIAKLEAYVEANRVALANDMARGKGETLSGLSHILGCNNPEQVNSLLQQNYGDIFNDHASPKNISQQIRKTLQSESNVGKTCQRLS